MSYKFVSKEAAERYAGELNGTNPNVAGVPLKYEADRYPDGTHDREQWPWGVKKLKQYPDRPELGWIFQGYVWKPAGRGL